MSKGIKILWIDDEVDLLNIHIMFLEQKGHKVTPVTNAHDAFDILYEEKFDIIFLDENMPGISGLDALPKLKELALDTPIVMITKNEDEAVMDEAIGSKISDYLIKPVKPQQILLAIKKNVYQKDLMSNQLGNKFREEFSVLSNEINQASHWNHWIDIYKKLVHWELLLEEVNDKILDDILVSLKQEANRLFGKYIKNNYLTWMEDEHPIMIHEVLNDRLFPYIDDGKPVFLIVIDNLRFDHWREIRVLLRDYVDIEYESLMFSILPTATQYARNAMFAGMLPADIKKYYPELWIDETQEGNKNEYEPQLLAKNLRRNGYNNKFHFHKVFNDQHGYKILQNLKTFLNSSLTVIVYNFVDMMSHAKTNLQMIKELAKDEKAYRNLTRSWFEHSSIYDLFKQLSGHDVRIILTTDHGAIRVQNPVKVIGDRETSTNIRYKQGKNLNYPAKKVFEILKPEKAGLPRSNIVSSFIFAMENDFLVYPNNYHQFANYYKDTFQHGGVSLEEMLIPFIEMKTR